LEHDTEFFFASFKFQYEAGASNSSGNNESIRYEEMSGRLFNQSASKELSP